MPALCIGTSGWVYPHWTRGVFYPPRLPAAAQLAFYARHFATVEINYSFYKLPERSTFASWREQTPPGFVFAVKASRYLTHLTKLEQPREPLARLLHSAGGLEEKLGPILFQLPGRWRVNLERLSAFLEALQPYAPQRFAFELRHRSWLVPEVFALLEQAGAALCLPVGWGIPLDVRLTAPWTYIRMHGGEPGPGFRDEELAPWAARIRGFLERGADVYVYFNDDTAGCAVHDAARLRAMLGQGAPVAAP